MTTLPYDTAVEDALRGLDPAPTRLARPAAPTALRDARAAATPLPDAARPERRERSRSGGDVPAPDAGRRSTTGSAGGAEGTPAPTRDAGRVPDEQGARRGRARLRLVPTVTPGHRPTGAPPPGAPPVLTERVARLVASVTPGEEEDRGDAPAVDPGRFAHGVGLACVEVVLGRRPAAQLARWLAPEVLDGLQQRASLVRRAGVLAHARRPAARRVRLCPLDAHTAEACLVVDDGVRVRAVALRLESHRGAWRVTTLEIG